MKHDLIQRLHDESDQCRNDGADDIAQLLDQAAAALQSLAHTATRLRTNDWSLRKPQEVADIAADKIAAALTSVPGGARSVEASAITSQSGLAALIAEMREWGNAKLPEFLGPHHMALTLSQKVNEWADRLAVASLRRPEP